MVARIKWLNRTGLSVAAALTLTALALGMGLTRHAVLGPAIDGPRGLSAWKVTFVASGRLRGDDVSITLLLPPDFRHQHIFDEQFQSSDLINRTTRGNDVTSRQVSWRRAGPANAGPVRLSYSFRCLLGMHQPTEHMKQRTHQIDGGSGGDTLRPSPLIQSDQDPIRRLASELTVEGQAQADMARAFYDRVRELETEPTLASQSAVDCLHAGRGDSGGKSRLLVALCRNRGIHARLLTGLLLSPEHDPALHHWAEAWVNGHWLPMDPIRGVFGSQHFPTNYLVLHLGDDDFFHGRGMQRGFVAQNLQDANDLGEDEPPSLLRTWLQQISLHALRPAEHQLVKILLLLPLGALIVAVFRTLIGVPTFGTFSPALIGIAFLDLNALKWGLIIFVGTVLVGWFFRKAIDRFHLLQVPRTAALLTLIVLFLLAVVVAASHFGILATQVIALFPLVILTHLVERFWTVESEDGTGASFRTLLGTMLVAVTISLALSPPVVSSWMFRYPETLGVVLAVNFLLGRYTGYRLSELIRFRDLADLLDEPPPPPPSANGQAGAGSSASSVPEAKQ